MCYVFSSRCLSMCCFFDVLVALFCLRLFGLSVMYDVLCVCLRVLFIVVVFFWVCVSCCSVPCVLSPFCGALVLDRFCWLRVCVCFVNSECICYVYYSCWCSMLCCSLCLDLLRVCLRVFGLCF